MHAVVLVLMFLAFFGMALWISRSLARRATCAVIRTFRQRDAVRPEAARSLRELGLVRPVFGLLRDYRPYAFQALAQAGIIQGTADGRFYLAEDNLSQAGGIQCTVI